MKELNNLKIIAVDHGYGNIKTANTVTPTGITAYDAEPAFSGNILEYNGVYYRVGEEHKDYRVHFTGCSLFPQGYPAILPMLGELRGTNLLSDIGNGTMNVLYLQNKKPVESRCWTEKFGVNQCVIAARNAVLDSLGVKLDEATVEQVLRFGTADIAKPYLDCIVSSAKDYVSDIFATLRKYEYNSDVMRLYVVGGGGCLVKNFGGYNEDRVTIFDDICATAKGYEYLAYTSLVRKRAA